MATTALTALHGDSWASPRWAVALNGAGTDLAGWHVRAQARQTANSDTTLREWTVDGGGIVIGSAEVRLSDDTLITTSTIQLVLRPADWADLPRSWAGVLDVEIASDDTATPDERRTIVPARKFQIVPDVSR